jgi:hypothetical protein
MITLVALATGLAIGWAAALTVERGVAPADADEMYARMSAALGRFDNTLERSTTVLKLTRQLTPENLEGGIRAFREQAPSPQLSAFDIHVFMAGWARIDGIGLLDQTLSWGADRFYRLGVAAVLHEFARNGDIERAKEVFFRSPEGAREQAVAALFVSWAAFGETEPLEEIVLSFPPGADRDVAMQILTGQLLLAQGSDALETWVESLEAPGPDFFKAHAYEHAVKALTIHSVNEARDWVTRQRETKQGWSRRGPEFLVEAWAKMYPAAAVDWALALEFEGDVERRVRARALSVGLERWVKANPEGAALWLLVRDSDRLFDVACEALALHYSRRAARQSAVFSNRIVADVRRERVEKTLRRAWSRLENGDQLIDLLGPDGPKTLLKKKV